MQIICYDHVLYEKVFYTMLSHLVSSNNIIIVCIHIHNALCFSAIARNRPSTTMIRRGRMYHLDDEEMQQVKFLLSCDGLFSLETPHC